MMNLSRSLTRPLLRVPNKLVISILAVALIGFADAAYLTIEHYRNVIPPCTTGGCETVLTSAYATVGGVPVALVGAIYYFLILIGAFACLESGSAKLLAYSLRLVMCGFIVTLFLLYLQAFVIHSFCTYCLGSAAITTTLFVMSLVTFCKYSTVSTTDESLEHSHN